MNSIIFLYRIEIIPEPKSEEVKEIMNLFVQIQKSLNAKIPINEKKESKSKNSKAYKKLKDKTKEIKDEIFDIIDNFNVED